MSIGRNNIKYARRLGMNPTLGKQQFIYLHKIVTGISKNYIHHFRDQNPLNLQRANLLITNLKNEPVKWFGSTNVSIFQGVKWDGYFGFWRAEFMGMDIGYYISEMDAAEAYNKKIIEVYGKDTDLNDLDIEVFNG
ncbi:MAG: hypothetical protein ACWGNI_00340 [Desulfobacterales bacterium]